MEDEGEHDNEDHVEQPVKPVPHRRREKKGPVGPRPEHEPFALVAQPILSLLAKFYGLSEEFFVDNVIITR